MYAALQKRQTLQMLELIPTVKTIHKTEHCELSLFLLTMVNVSLQDVTLQNQRAMSRESGCRKNVEVRIWKILLLSAQSKTNENNRWNLYLRHQI